MILFPEGTRSKDGKIQTFRKGVSLFAQETKTPILFLYIEGNSDLWPKGQLIPSPGKLIIHIGPVHEPAPADVLHNAYTTWVRSVDPNAQIADLPH
jgi:1-acyl-sn-glycerol-3-phosphate acyltransferase